jgi:hypothetical protein
MQTEQAPAKSGASRAAAPKKNSGKSGEPRRPDVDTPNQRGPAKVKQDMQRSPRQENL